MADATYEAAFDPHARAANLRYVAQRIAVYAFLGFFALIYLPAVVRHRRQLVPRVAGDRAQRSHRNTAQLVASRPGRRLGRTTASPARAKASSATFYNSLFMTIPATIISTLLGAINGYVLSKWRFPGSETLFACMTLGVFMPGQIALLPWAFVLGSLGPVQLDLRPHSRPRHTGALVHDAVLPQLLRQHSRRPHQGGAHRRGGILAHLLQDRAADLAADPHRHGYLAVHRHLERISVRGRFHRRAPAADHRGAGRATDRSDERPSLRRRKLRRADRRGAAALDLLSSAASISCAA